MATAHARELHSTEDDHRVAVGPTVPRLLEVDAPEPERPLWQLIVMLYAAVALVVVLVVAVVFIFAWVVAGAPY
jgi:heme/copper-type cytochrome/quinol oxidase subunit 2